MPERFLRSGHWSRAFIKWVKEIKFEYGTAEYSLKILIAEVENMRSLMLEITREIRQLSLTEDYRSNMELLRSVPGIGLITDITFLTQIEDIEHFPDTDNFAAYMGLVPNCHSTGDKENTERAAFELLELKQEVADI